MSDPENARGLAAEYGHFVVTQDRQKLKITNQNVSEYLS